MTTSKRLPTLRTTLRAAWNIYKGLGWKARLGVAVAAALIGTWMLSGLTEILSYLLMHKSGYLWALGITVMFGASTWQRHKERARSKAATTPKAKAKAATVVKAQAAPEKETLADVAAEFSAEVAEEGDDE